MPLQALPSRLQLVRELERLRREPQLNKRSLNDLFVLWFLMAYATNDDMDRAREALTGARGDSGVDAVYIDHKKHVAYVVQGKLRQQVGRRAESGAEVNAFVEYARLLWGTKANLRAYCLAQHMDEHAADKLELVRARLTADKRYVLQLCFVTLGKFTQGTSRSAHLRITGTHTETELLLIDGHQVLYMFENYLDGVVHVPPVELRVRPGAPNSAGTLTRNESGLESRVLTMSADDVAELLDRVGPAIFARNIRGPLGRTPVNKELGASVKGHPELFWYLNNGVTILCDEIESAGRAGVDYLNLSNPQIINGQQTTTALHDVWKDERSRPKLRRANVLVRVIRVPAEGPETESFDEFVSSVVQATNWQNKIEASDLRSNDPWQVALQRQLRSLGYEYLRKRESKGSARRNAGVLRTSFITKFELAQAVAGCEFDSLPLRVGREPLFTSLYYGHLFPKKDVYFYLTRYWVSQAVAQFLRGSGERRSLRWPLVYFLWHEVGQLIDRRAERFYDAYVDSRSPASRALEQLIRNAESAAYRFYRLERRSGGETIALDDFFKRDTMTPRRGNAAAPLALFMRYWDSGANRETRERFEAARVRLDKGLMADQGAQAAS